MNLFQDAIQRLLKFYKRENNIIIKQFIMLTLNDKIQYLEKYLSMPTKNYADTFKEDIIMFLDDFTNKNKLLLFLNKLDSFVHVENWVDNLCSRIVLKFDYEAEHINDFIYDYVQFG